VSQVERLNAERGFALPKLKAVTDLNWDGCVNVRDLGGLPAEDGRWTIPGRVVRSDNVRKLSDAGWRALAHHGVTRIVDLRMPEELAEDQPRDVDIDVVHVSVLGDAWDLEYGKELDASLDAVDDVADHYAFSYVGFLERWRDRFGLALAAIADAPDGAVVVHCAGGKDRTGLVAALLLRAAGVSREEVARDYARSGGNLAPTTEPLLAAVEDPVERARWTKLSRTPAEGMLRVLEEIERRYGDVASYLRAAGLTDAQIGRLRERLVAT
jgi:protein tyrosine/serine phosphatase